MKKNLKNKIALIFAVLLICLYGIFGIPSGSQRQGPAGSHDQAHSSGPRSCRAASHLILQVQVSEAVSDETDSTVQDIQQA